MPTPRRSNWGIGRISAVALALILIVPIPAFALTFLGNWQFFVIGSDSPGTPSPAFNVVDDLQGGLLEINMGEFIQNGFSGFLTVTAIRDFRINGAAELVTITRSFTSLLGDGRIRVTVNITPYNISNPPPFSIPVVNRNREGLPIAQVGDNSVNTGLFIGGNYRVTINITYEKNANGYWKNITPHRFDFFGI